VHAEEISFRNWGEIGEAAPTTIFPESNPESGVRAKRESQNQSFNESWAVFLGVGGNPELRNDSYKTRGEWSPSISEKVI